MGTLKGKGRLILTTLRLVLVNEHGKDFRAFDIPYANLFLEKFHDRVFGAKYWEGTVKPLFNSLPGDVHFKIWFYKGGCIDLTWSSGIIYVQLGQIKELMSAQPLLQII